MICLANKKKWIAISEETDTFDMNEERNDKDESLDNSDLNERFCKDSNRIVIINNDEN